MKILPGSKRLRTIVRLTLWGCALLLILAVGVLSLPGQVPPWARLEPEPTAGEVAIVSTDRVLVLAPHPDDEALACGGVIQSALAQGAAVEVVFLTCGDANELSFLLYRHRPVVAPSAVLAMGRVRHDEALAAGAILGLDASALTFLGYPDAGTFDIWLRHWASARPMRSMLTRVDAVPYDFALRPKALYRGQEVLEDVTQVIARFAPTKIFVSHSGDGNGDHRALYLFTRVALWDLEDRLKPSLHPYLVHAPHWPRPGGPNPGRPLVPPQVFRSRIAWSSLPVSPEENQKKRRAIEAHRSQCGYSSGYLLSFVRANEMFGDFPALVVAAPSFPAPSATGNVSPTGTPLEVAGSPPAGSPSVAASSPRAPSSLPVAPSPLAASSSAVLSYAEKGVLGSVWHSMEVVDGRLALRTAFERPVARQATVEVWLFGWRKDRPFADMPKLHILSGPTGVRAMDGTHRVASAALESRSSAHERSLGIPLGLLGDPRRILVSARGKMSRFSLEPPCWEVVQVNGTLR